MLQNVKELRKAYKMRSLTIFWITNLNLVLCMANITISKCFMALCYSLMAWVTGALDFSHVNLFVTKLLVFIYGKKKSVLYFIFVYWKLLCLGLKIWSWPGRGSTWLLAVISCLCTWYGFQIGNVPKETGWFCIAKKYRDAFPSQFHI